MDAGCRSVRSHDVSVPETETLKLLWEALVVLMLFDELMAAGDDEEEDRQQEDSWTERM